MFAGHSRFGLRAEGAAAAEAEAHDSSPPARRDPDSVPLEVLRCRRELVLSRDLENPLHAAAFTACVSWRLQTSRRSLSFDSGHSGQVS